MPRTRILVGWWISWVIGCGATAAEAPWIVPRLPGGESQATLQSAAFLTPVAPLQEGVAVARTVPTVEVLVYPGQDYAGKPWSNWGQGTWGQGQYFSAIGDHLSPAGTARVFAYDPARQTIRQLVDLKSFYQRPAGVYCPAKIHSRLDLGKDGWLYFSTHRGSPQTSTDQFHYEGDDILRVDPQTARIEVVARFPVTKHSLPTSVLDADRLIFYAGSAAGQDSPLQSVQFLAYDVRQQRVLCQAEEGPPRCLALARSTGRVYYVPGREDVGPVWRFDPATDRVPVKLPVVLGARAASDELPGGVIYLIANGQGGHQPTIYALDVRTEQVTPLGTAAVGTETYITSLAADQTGRYLYYVPGAHGSAERDGTPVIQFDTRNRTRKVIAFLHAPCQQQLGFSPEGTYSVVAKPDGSQLFITFNSNRGTKSWDFVTQFVVHVPAVERP